MWLRPRPAPGHFPQVSRDAQAPAPPGVLAPLPSSEHLLAGTPPPQRSTHQGQRSQGQPAMQGSVKGLSWPLMPRARAVPGGSQVPKGCPAPLKPPPPWAERPTPPRRPSCVPTPVPIVTSFLFCCHCLMAESEKWEEKRGRDCACWGPGREGCSERYKLKGAEHRQHEAAGRLASQGPAETRLGRGALQSWT